MFRDRLLNGCLLASLLINGAFVLAVGNSGAFRRENVLAALRAREIQVYRPPIPEMARAARPRPPLPPRLKPPAPRPIRRVHSAARKPAVKTVAVPRPAARKPKPTRRQPAPSSVASAPRPGIRRAPVARTPLGSGSSRGIDVGDTGGRGVLGQPSAPDARPEIPPPPGPPPLPPPPAIETPEPAGNGGAKNDAQAAPPPPVPEPPKAEPPPPPPPPRQQPLVRARPKYRRNPPPVYPEEARRQRWEGVVLLLVSVDGGGNVTDVQVQRGCGHTALDEAALKVVRGWEFEPARRGDMPVPSRIIVPLRFKLE